MKSSIAHKEEIYASPKPTLLKDRQRSQRKSYMSSTNEMGSSVDQSTTGPFVMINQRSQGMLIGSCNFSSATKHPNGNLTQLDRS